MPVNRKPEINYAVELTPAFRDVLPGTVRYGLIAARWRP